MEHILLHGLGQTAGSWREVIAGLGGPERSFLCPELSELSSCRPVTYDSLYRGFTALCRGISGPLALCGLSLGGVLALHYAIDYPERVGALALIGTQYRMPKGLLSFQNAVFRLMPERAFRGMGWDKADVIALCRSMGELDLSAGLPDIACPTLVVCGERDRANRKAAQELARRIPGAALSIVPGAGHELDTEDPEALSTLLGKFFPG